MVDQVTKVDLREGNTMIIPTGWIHAVVRCLLTPHPFFFFSPDLCAVYTPRRVGLRWQFPTLVQRCTPYVLPLIFHMSLIPCRTQGARD